MRPPPHGLCIFSLAPSDAIPPKNPTTSDEDLL